jgi:tetratricopeptide (TPR) repeat protein
MRRVPDRLRPFLLACGGVVLTLPWAWSAAENVKPDPNGLTPHAVKDLRYGDVLFYYFQGDYFAAITRLLAARQLGLIPNEPGEAELLLGGLYLSLGEHVEAGKIFEALLAGNTTETVRNRAWYYLGKVWYLRGYLPEAERALRQVSDHIDPRINAERYMLLAQLMMQQSRYDDAIAALQDWRGPPDWTAYARFNLGVALVRKERLSDAIPLLDSVGSLQPKDEETSALRDKANLALGFALLQAQRATEATPILQRVRLEGPYSSKALLGAGWAQAMVGDFKRALVPWLALHNRNLLDAAVQESFLAVPYAFGKLGANGQAAEYYESAIRSFDAETRRIDESIVKIRGGDLLDRLLANDDKASVSWYWQLQNLPNAPESRYLYQLLASNDFQEGLKNYRELKYMSRNVESWRDSVAAFDDILATREAAYAERAPKTDTALAATNIDVLSRKRMDFESRINEIEKSGDVAALGTPQEQATWARLKRIEEYLAAHPGDPELAEMRDKERLMMGVVYWRLSESFKARIWNERRSVKELEAGIQETQRRAVQVQQARQGIPANTSEYAARVAAVRARMDVMQRRLAAASGQQNRYLQGLAIHELEAQKDRLATYQIQARYALADIYDRTLNDKPGSGKAAGGGSTQPKATP